MKVALLFPAATVTLPGTLATVLLLLERETTRPPTGAAPLSVTVPVEVLPPTTVVGLRERDVNEGGLTLRVDDLLTPL